ncbi:MAG: hypothetical protein K6G84_01450 [Lachnospiraceae bacterium]|nr:hypothetical protein [Lachnospiraceae bacterium]
MRFNDEERGPKGIGHPMELSYEKEKAIEEEMHKVRKINELIDDLDMSKVNEILGFKDKYIDGSDYDDMFDEWCGLLDDLLSIATCIHHKESLSPEMADSYDFRQYAYLIFNDRIKHFDASFMIGVGLLLEKMLERYGFFHE